MKVSAIVVAAGSGTRMRSSVKKPFIELAGIPLFIRTLQAIEQSNRIKDIVLVVEEEEIDTVKRFVEQYGLRKINRYAPGGSERQESVYQGVLALDQDAEIVVVHDGARPFVSVQELEGVIDAAIETGAATIGTPVKETIKQAANGFVETTIPRQSLYAVQTPQAFQTHILRAAHEKANTEGVRGTDDASLVEWLGQPTRLIIGSYRNIKITTPEDLVIAEAFLQTDH